MSRNPIAELNSSNRTAKARSSRGRSSAGAGIGWKLRLVLVGAVTLAMLLILSAAAIVRAPKGNTESDHFDALLVLGYPADSDGNPTPEQLSRVTEAVHEYNRGVASRILFSGAAVHNRFVEAEVMARTAESMGVPASAILIEPQATNTIENACYSTRLLQAHGLRSAEVISSPFHLPRAGWIFAELPLQWHVHAAPPLSNSAFEQAVAVAERAKILRYFLWSRWTNPCELPSPER